MEETILCEEYEPYVPFPAPVPNALEGRYCPSQENSPGCVCKHGYFRDKEGVEEPTVFREIGLSWYTNLCVRIEKCENKTHCEIDGKIIEVGVYISCFINWNQL